MTSKTEAASRDKYYTRPEIARRCWPLLRKHLRSDHLLIEPSAGDGVWLRTIEGERDIRGYDLYPDAHGHSAIQRLDFLRDDALATLPEADQGRPIAMVGNPPFGRRCKMALDFLNRSLAISDLAGFILPKTFRKWSIQSKVVKGARLIADHDLPEDSFTIMTQPFAISCCFQVWTICATAEDDLRLKERPATQHPDFEMAQWNCTDGARHIPDQQWDFAVRRQGHGVYTPLFDLEGLDLRRQWTFFRTDSAAARLRLLSLDFGALAALNAKVPGFGKADVVRAYEAALSADKSGSTSPEMMAANSDDALAYEAYAA